MFSLPREILKSREGTVSQVPFALLLQAIVAEERSVVLELRRRQLEKKISFEEGIPVGCQSNLLHETLGRFLLERGQLTEAQCHEALAQAARDGEPLGEVLVRRGMLSPYDLYRAMQQNVARRILDCFTWTDATFRLSGEPQAGETPLAMNPAQLIHTAATTVMPFEVVSLALAAFEGRRFARVPRPPQAPEALKLGPKDTKVLALLARRPTLDELCAQVTFSREEVLRRLYAFGVVGMIGLSDGVKEPAPAPAPPAPEPLMRAEPARVSSPSELQAKANGVMEAFLRHRSQDPFDLLGVAETAGHPEIRRAYLSFAERFRPALFTGELAAVADKAEELFLAGARAFGVLWDPESRALAAERRRRRAEEARRKKGEAGAGFRIQTQLLDAEEHFRRGLARFLEGDWRGAVELFEFACDIDPTRAVYRAHLGWAHFKFAPSNADKALKELCEAERLDPRCDAALYFEGQIRANTGDLAGAAECFRRAIKAKPDEKKYTDALRAVSVAGKSR